MRDVSRGTSEHVVGAFVESEESEPVEDCVEVLKECSVAEDLQWDELWVIFKGCFNWTC